MDLRSSSRSSRSRSKTPLNLVTETSKENHLEIEQSVSRSTRKTTTTIVKTGNGSNSFDSISEEVHRSHHVKPSSKRITRSAKLYKTSDYSSEEGENEVSSTRQNLSDNDRNRILEDARKATTDTTDGNTALGLYRRAKRYWDEYPKTDWTYSPFSKDRIELAPGVVAMPNMSRRHISSYDRYISSGTQTIRPQKLFSSEDGHSESTVSSFTTYTKKILFSIVMVFVGVFYLSWSSVTYIYKLSHLLSIKVAKSIYRLTSRVMLLDTWLLKKRGSSGKITSLMVLCLLPLLMLAGWWIFSFVGDNLYEKLFKSSSNPVPEYPNTPTSPSDKDFFQFNLKDDDLQKIANHLNEQTQKNQVDENEIVNKLLSSDTIQSLIKNYKDNLSKDELEEKFQDEFHGLRMVIKELADELNQMKTELKTVQSREIDINQLKSQIQEENIRKIDSLVFQLNRCCRKSINIESHIHKVLTSSLNNPDFLQRQEGLKNWLHYLFVAEDELESKLENLTENISNNFDETLKINAKFLMDKVTERIDLGMKYKFGDFDDLSDDKIRRIVNDVLKIYDADKTGLVDYAMEPMGGEIVTTRCTETYRIGRGVVSVLGVPLWYSSATPRTVITPGINPGNCWAFQNFPGLIVIKLMAPIKIEAFSLEHVSKLLVPDGKIDSAPREFEVYGLESEGDRNGVKIGEYKYESEGDSLQFFIAHKPDQIFEYIELRILSNHGNPNYTCLYRFRVHGKRIA